MVILVTGGSGFIGSHIVDKLLEKHYDVRVFDKMKPLCEDVEWHQGDLSIEEEILEACRDVDVVFHLAAIADVNTALSHPDLCVKVNEGGTVNLLKASRAREVERVILASTTWVYGANIEIVNEETPIPMPDHIYTKTKIGQEHLVYTWNKHYGLSYTILRYDIPYGPRMRRNMAIDIFARRAMEGKQISVFGDGEQGRCFIYIEDIAEGSIAALRDEAKNEVFNIAGDKFVTMNHVVQNLKQILGQINVKREPPRPGDFRGTRVSVEKAEKLLGWKPKISFSEGLKKYVKHLSSEASE